MLRIAYLSIDSKHPRQLASFWGQLLNADVTTEGDEAWLKAETDHGDGYVGLLFIQSDEPKQGRNRLHLELAPDDHDAQVARAVSLGATQLSSPSASRAWSVLSDPEGNEFLVLQLH